MIHSQHRHKKICFALKAIEPVKVFVYACNVAVFVKRSSAWNSFAQESSSLSYEYMKTQSKMLQPTLVVYFISLYFLHHMQAERGTSRKTETNSIATSFSWAFKRSGTKEKYFLETGKHNLNWKLPVFIKTISSIFEGIFYVFKRVIKIRFSSPFEWKQIKNRSKKVIIERMKNLRGV